MNINTNIIPGLTEIKDNDAENLSGGNLGVYEITYKGKGGDVLRVVGPITNKVSMNAPGSARSFTVKNLRGDKVNRRAFQIESANGVESKVVLSQGEKQRFKVKDFPNGEILVSQKPA